jgi:8-oxo-dGTP pyrophosphatase MutT (NUDIX family)
VSEGLVRAAGGIVVRRPRPDEPEVLLVSRAKYGDWSFPKGKRRAGEDDVACALREVEEETGLRCALERELGFTAYVDGSGRDKVVRWYLMRPPDADAVAANEIAQVRWASLDDAARLLTWKRDVELLASL